MSEENSVNVEADEIAKKLIETLVEGFKAKEKRDPTPEEVGELMAELSEERIAALLSGEHVDEPENEKVEEDNKPEAEAEQAEEPKIEDKENVQKKSNKDDENIVKEVKDDDNITGKKRDAEEVEEVASFKWPKAAA